MLGASGAVGAATWTGGTGSLTGGSAPGAVIPVSEPGALVAVSTTPPSRPPGCVVTTAGGVDSAGLSMVTAGLSSG